MAQVTKDGKRFFKLRNVYNVTSTAGGEINFVANNSPTTMGDWTAISSLFDVYKIAATKIKYIPEVPFDTSAMTEYKPMYVIADENSASNPVTNAAESLQYENCKVKNLYKPWSYYHKWAIMSSLNSANVVLSKGYRSIVDTGGYSGIYANAYSVTPSTQYGSMVITHYIVAKNRR